MQYVYLCRLCHGQYMKNQSQNNETLEKHQLNVSQIWYPQIRGVMGESSPCYTYSSQGKRGIGAFNRVIVLNVGVKTSLPYKEFY